MGKLISLTFSYSHMLKNVTKIPQAFHCNAINSTILFREINK